LYTSDPSCMKHKAPVQHYIYSWIYRVKRIRLEGPNEKDGQQFDGCLQ
jgi:hypothetical protein